MTFREKLSDLIQDLALESARPPASHFPKLEAAMDEARVALMKTRHLWGVAEALRPKEAPP